MQNDVRLIDANVLKEDLKNMLARVMYESDLDFDHSHAKIWTATITGIQHSIKRLDNAPTIDAVEVVHGRWIEHPDDRCSLFNGWECSECKQIVSGGRGNYCPNCGAKMDAQDMDVPTKDGGAESV